MTTALICVDLQRDFCEGGALPVVGGNRVCQRIAEVIRNRTPMQYQYIVATKDWHLPADSNGGHISANPDFVSTWPAHCVQGTEGAQFHPDIAEIGYHDFDAVFYKGIGRPDYSGFQGWAQHGPDEEISLFGFLHERGVTKVDIVGLATDYCVKATAMDAIQLGFHVRIPQALTAAVGGPEQRDLWIKTVYAAQGSSLHLN